MLSVVRAAAFGLVLMSAPQAFAQAVSAEVGRPLQNATRLAQSGSTAAALAEVNRARAAASTPAERRKVGEAAAFVYTKARQFGPAARELEAIGAGPRQLAPFYYGAGQFQKAIDTAKRAGGTDMQVIVAQSNLRLNRPKEAIAVYQQLIRTAGPRAQWLENMARAQFESGDKAGYLQSVRQMIRVDPSPARWKTLLSSMRGQNMSNEAKLVLYQLMLETGNLTRPEDFQEMAKLAILDNQPGVARRALGRAVAANVIQANDAMTSRLIQEANRRAQMAEAGIARLPRTPQGFLQAGNIYFGAERYPQAANAFAQAARAVTPAADQARVLGGIALLRANNPAGARARFNSVPAGSGYKDVADLWSLYASTRPA